MVHVTVAGTVGAGVETTLGLVVVSVICCCGKRLIPRAKYIRICIKNEKKGKNQYLVIRKYMIVYAKGSG